MSNRNFIPITLTEQQIDSFWSRVERLSQNDCWPYNLTKNRKGYGLYKVWVSRDQRYKTFLAHRVAYVLTFGQPTQCVLHKCDYKPCCNPNHLYDGTDFDNARDLKERGNRPIHRGEKHGNSKLTNEQVRTIKKCLSKSSVNMSAIARYFSVNLSTIQKIRNGVTWTHIV